MFFSTPLHSQAILEDLKPYITVYDSQALSRIPSIVVFSGKFGSLWDSSFAGFYELKNSKVNLLTYYPYTNLSFINYCPIRNGPGYFWRKLFPVLQSLGGVQVTDIFVLDSNLQITDTVIINYPFSYTYDNLPVQGVIKMDAHDQEIIYLNGRRYAVSIGVRDELSDETSLMEQDSVIVTYTSIHIIDVAAKTEVVRWDAKTDGFELAPFYEPRVLDKTVYPYIYRHPHINNIETHLTQNGLDIFFSSRHPGEIGKLTWNGVADTMQLAWLFGTPPKSPVNHYLYTQSTTLPKTCHGASALYKGDTIYIATYNNNHNDSVSIWPVPITSGSRFQVYRVLNDTAALIWESPDIHFDACCRGDALWNGDYLMVMEGLRGGIVTGIDSFHNYTFSENYQDLQIWSPFTNTLIAGLQVPGDIGIAEWLDTLPVFSPVTVVTSGNNIILSYPTPELKYWTVSGTKVVNSVLVLPIANLDSLEKISAWIQTGYSGVWQITDKQIITNLGSAPLVGLTFIPTILKLAAMQLPEPYSWYFYDITGRQINRNQIVSGAWYLVEARWNNETIYRKKHLVMQ